MGTLSQNRGRQPADPRIIMSPGLRPGALKTAARRFGDGFQLEKTRIGSDDPNHIQRPSSQDQAPVNDTRCDAVTVPAGRVRALTRAVAWSVPAAGAVLPAVLLFSRVDLSRSALSSRMVELSLAAAAVPFALAALGCMFVALRWLLFAAWPARVGIVAEAEALELRLGPFGSQRYDTAQLDVRYPFELIEDEEDGGFEAFLPEDEQYARLLPCMRHPRASEPLNRTMLKFVSGSEEELAAALRPMIQRWRTVHSGEVNTTEAP